MWFTNLTGAVDMGVIIVPALDQTRCIIGGLKATVKRFYWLIPIDGSDHALFRKSPLTREGPRAAHSGSRRQHSAAINSIWAVSVQATGTSCHGPHQGVVSVSTVQFFNIWKPLHRFTAASVRQGSMVAGWTLVKTFPAVRCLCQTHEGWVGLLRNVSGLPALTAARHCDSCRCYSRLFLSRGRLLNTPGCGLWYAFKTQGSGICALRLYNFY